MKTNYSQINYGMKLFNDTNLVPITTTQTSIDADVGVLSLFLLLFVFY